MNKTLNRLVRGVVGRMDIAHIFNVDYDIVKDLAISKLPVD